MQGARRHVVVAAVIGLLAAATFVPPSAHAAVGRGTVRWTKAGGMSPMSFAGQFRVNKTQWTGTASSTPPMKYTDADGGGYYFVPFRIAGAGVNGWLFEANCKVTAGTYALLAPWLLAARSLTSACTARINGGPWKNITITSSGYLLPSPYYIADEISWTICGLGGFGSGWCTVPGGPDLMFGTYEQVMG
jgi:hypothetical protein